MAPDNVVIVVKRWADPASTCGEFILDRNGVVWTIRPGGGRSCGGTADRHARLIGNRIIEE